MPTRDNPITYLLRHGGNVRLPIVSTICWSCGQHAEPNTEGVSASRVNGDSRYGYESYHDACAEAELQAFRDEP